MTTPALMEQTVDVLASTVRVTGLPEPPPVAVGVSPGPPTTAVVGAVEVKWIVCAALATAKDCGVCGAAA